MQYFGDRGCSIKSVSVTPASYVPGDTLTISFKLSLTSGASGGDISGAVDVMLGVGFMEGGEPVGFNGAYIKTYTKQSIKRGASKTYTFSVPVTYAPRADFLDSHPGDFLWLSVDAKCASGYYSLYVADAVVWLDGRAAPAIGAGALTDRASMLNPAQGSPLDHFGGILQGASLPRLAFSFALDPVNANDTTLTAAHRLTYTSGAAVKAIAAATGHGETGVAFDLDAPPASGAVQWTYTVTDSYGMSATASGSFAVLPYSPPAITDFALERYADVIDGGGHSHVAADDGELAWLSLEASVAPVNGQNAWVATFTAWPEGMDEPEAVRGEGIVRGTDGYLAGLEGWDLAGSGAQVSLLRDEAQLAGFAPSAAVSWVARITVEDALGNGATLLCRDIEAAATILDAEPWGVGIGMRSRGRRNELDPATGEVTEVRQAVDIAEDWLLRVRGPMAVAPGQLMKVVTVTGAIPQQSVAAGGYVTVRTPLADLESIFGDGWTPLMIAGWRGSGRYAQLYQCRIDTETDELAVSAHNPSTSDRTFSVDVDVLCLRTLTEDGQAPAMDDVVVVAHMLILGNSVDAEVSGTTLVVGDSRFSVDGTTLYIT